MNKITPRLSKICSRFAQICAIYIYIYICIYTLCCQFVSHSMICIPIAHQKGSTSHVLVDVNNRRCRECGVLKPFKCCDSGCTTLTVFTIIQYVHTTVYPEYSIILKYVYIYIYAYKNRYLHIHIYIYMYMFSQGQSYCIIIYSTV